MDCQLPPILGKGPSTTSVLTSLGRVVANSVSSRTLTDGMTT